MKMKFANSRRLYQIAAIMGIVLFFLPALAADKKPSGEKVAVVNGVVITRAQYDKELNVQRQRVSRQGRQISDDQMAEMKTETLEGLIEREVLYQESQKAGIKITDQKVNDQVASIKKRFPSEEEFNKALSKMNLAEDEIRVQILRGLAIRELIDQKVASKVVITDEETRAYYDGNSQLFQQPEQVKASHILIKVEPTADDAKKAEARKKIVEVQQKLKDGGDFAALAKEYSQGPSGSRGGDLGYFKRGQMVKPFDDAAFSMKTNEVSDLVESHFGYHIIKIYGKKPEQILAYADVKDKIAQRLKQEKVEKDATLYVENLKKGAKVKKSL
jgi:peptidyl-prolyl cis-trans isomerase C